MTLLRCALAVFSTVVLVGSLSCRSRDAGERARPNVLLISIDTLRADHVGAYGYPLPTTPFLDELAASGVRFDVARAPSSWTAPSLATLLTGVLPHVHGVGHGWIDDHDVVMEQEPLPGSIDTLAESLSSAGYRTYGLSSNGHASAKLGFGAGFDDFEDLPFADLDRVLPAWRSLLGRLRSDDRAEDGDRPWFVWVHLLDPHAPYLPYGPYVSEVWPSNVARRDYLARHLSALDFNEMELSEEELRYLVTLYDSEIRRTDDFVRTMVRALRPGENTITIVVADHGEQFGEHGFFGHGQHLYEGSVRVPFLLHYPARLDGPRVVETPVALTDVVPTVHDLVGLPAPRRSDGNSLVTLVEKGNPLRRTLFGSLQRRADMHMTVEGNLKLIEERGAGWTLLFDLARDPDEEQDLSTRRGPDLERLRQARSFYLDSVSAVDADEAVPLSPEEKKRLEALGYVQ